MLTLTSSLARTVRLHGDRPAVVGSEGRFTWKGFAERIARAAGMLHTLGIGQGQRFAILCQNSFRHAELLHAGCRLGAVPVPINYRLAPPEIADVLENADCTVLVLDEALADLMASEELAPWSGNVLVIGSLSTDRPWPVYDTMLEQAAPAQPIEPSEGDDALLLYTGGTTGRAKGVRLSHLNIISNALQLGFELGPRSDDVYLRVAPMFHSADLLATPYAMAGAAQVFLPKFSGRALFEAIETYRVTVTLMTPTMLIMAMQEPDIDNYDLSSLRQVIYGSSPMTAEWIRKVLDRFEDVDFVQAYGLTETSPILTLLHAADHKRAMATGRDDLLKSVGRQIPGVDLMIVDSEGRELPAGQPGEVIVRGPNVSKGYLKRQDATAESFRQGWFYTGDIGQVDDDGYLFLLDRKKDVIITGGEMVFSSEVEAALYQHPKVHECAVIGVPDETYGEALLAVIVPAPGHALTQDELIAHCRGRIGGYKIPRRYVFSDELPKSAMDKILKTELRRIHGKKG
jgi:long-chain acyl-CoA synthetase